MNVSSSALLFAVAVTCAPAGAQKSQATAQAHAAVSKWLALVDAGDCSQSWKQAAGLFRSGVSELAWVKAVHSARAPLGAVIARKAESTTVVHSVPGAPGGNYVVIKYATRFANKQNAVETVTPHQETDSSWHVSGYFIK